MLFNAPASGIEREASSRVRFLVDKTNELFFDTEGLRAAAAVYHWANKRNLAASNHVSNGHMPVVGVCTAKLCLH